MQSRDIADLRHQSIIATKYTDDQKLSIHLRAQHCYKNSASVLIESLPGEGLLKHCLCEQDGQLVAAQLQAAPPGRHECAIIVLGAIPAAASDASPGRREGT